MTISGWVTQSPVEVVLRPTAVDSFITQVAVEVINLQYYTHNPALGDDAVYYVGNESTDQNPNKVNPGGNKGGAQGSVITLLAFEDIKVPQGSNIIDAWITFTASDSDSTTTVNADIYALDQDNPEIPETYDDLLLAPKTTSYAVWDDIAAWVAENEYNSVSVKDVVQEIINRTGWEFGNTIVILFEDDSSTVGAYRQAYSKLTAGKEPQLTILWDYTTYSLNAPVLDPINNPLSKNSYTVSWNTVAGATQYELSEQYNEENWQVIYTGALLSQNLSDKDVGTWSYRVRAYDGSDWSGFSNVESTGVSKALVSDFNISISI